MKSIHIDSLKRAMRQHFKDEPVRGLTSKKKRQLNKSNKRYATTFKGLLRSDKDRLPMFNSIETRGEWCVGTLRIPIEE